MPLFKDEAFILRGWDLGESDRIISFFSRRHGKLRAVAKGARKIKSRFSGRLEPLHKTDLAWYGKEGVSLYKLSGVEIAAAFPSLFDSVEKFYYASYLAESAEAGLKEGDPHPQAFGVLLNTLHWLEEAEEGFDWMIRFFDIRFLGALGYRPALEACVSCQKPWTGATQPAFDAHKGGILCPRCAGDRPGLIVLTVGAAKFFSQIHSVGFDKARRMRPSPAALEEISRAVRAFRSARLGGEIKSERFLT